MIWESQYWRDDLHRRALVLRDKKRQRRWSSISFGLLEQTVMLGFYSIRKLAEAHKIPRSKYEQPVNLFFYHAKGKPVTMLNWHNLDDLYDVNVPSETREPLSFVSNQIIHSFIFMPILEAKHGLDRIVFNSDRTRKAGIYCIKVDEVIRVFTSVSGSYVGKGTYFHLTKDGGLKVMTDEEVNSSFESDS